MKTEPYYLDMTAERTQECRRIHAQRPDLQDVVTTAWQCARVTRTLWRNGKLAFKRHACTIADPTPIGGHLRVYSFDLKDVELVPCNLVELSHDGWVDCPV